MSGASAEYRWTVDLAAQTPARRLGPRLDDFLADRLPSLSRMHLRSAVRAGAVLVNGRPAPPGFRLHAGAQVQARLDPDRLTAMTPQDIPLEIVYEDERLAVVVKPAGMLVHPTRAVKTGTLANALAGLWNRTGGAVVRPIFAHRLDKQTSGLMAVAKDRETGARLARAFAQGEVHKRYLAWLDGLLEPDSLAIDAPIARLSETPPQWRTSPAGKPARTLLRVLRRAAGRTLAELEPLTGRTNQLRIHCAAIGHPIAGDSVYGGSTAPRLYLHAFALDLPGGEAGRRLRFSSPPGEDEWEKGPAV